MSISRARTNIAAAVAAVLFAPSAFSHVTLETKQAPVDSHYKAVFRVGHGCKGSPTVKIRVRVPEGMVGIKPQPKPGWTLQTIKGEYAKPYTLYGAQVSAGVKEVVWTGGPLLDEHYDEFIFVGYLSGGLTPDTSLFFPVVQECEQGVARWIDLPSAGNKATSDHTDTPAPALKLLPKQ
ncbi:YcnI family protein [Allopusillimonas ginsengisoli]|uniref:YcnI family copper-binding membrane protein n=1 Tax=Allopusillimonas ginsengisoli TaxID=453575 RepID=UPI0039C1256B